MKMVNLFPELAPLARFPALIKVCRSVNSPIVNVSKYFGVSISRMVASNELEIVDEAFSI